MAEGCLPVAREWQGAIGLQDSMVVVAGRLDIPEYEPIPLSSDTMCTNVEILWHRPPSSAQPPTGTEARPSHAHICSSAIKIAAAEQHGVAPICHASLHSEPCCCLRSIVDALIVMPGTSSGTTSETKCEVDHN